MLNCDDRILQSHQPVSIDNPDSSRAAVAMVLRRNSAHEEMLFIRRASSERDPWSGQIALPGGGWERDDASLLHTARRETHEEVGLALKPEECVGRLDDQPGQNRSRQLSLTISCYVFRLNRRQSLTLNSEVAEAFWVPLEVLLDRSRQRAYRAPHASGTVMAIDIELPGPTGTGAGRTQPTRLLWGLTHRFVQQLLAVCQLDCDGGSTG